MSDVIDGRAKTLAMKRNRTSRNRKMERSRSEDVSSSDEPDPKRHKRDNLGPATRKKKSNLKNVLVLTGRDVRKSDDKVYLTNTMEMAQLKKPEHGQFKTEIKLPKTMTEKDVEAELRRQFPVLRRDGRFYCGTLVEKRTRVEFHDNPPTVWDGIKINRRIRGNSALYVYFEETPESVFERPEPQTVDILQQQRQTRMPEPIGSSPSYSEKLKSLKRKHDPSSSLVPEVMSSTGASVKKQVMEGTRHEGNKEGEQQSPLEQLGYHRGNSTASLLCNSGTFHKTQNQQTGLKESAGEDHSKEPQVVTEDSAYETAAGNASDVDDKTKHSIGEIGQAPSGVVERIEDYLQNSKVDSFLKSGIFEPCLAGMWNLKRKRQVFPVENKSYNFYYGDGLSPSEGSSLEDIDLIRISPHHQINLSEGELNEIYQDVLGITLFEPVITKLCPKEGPITGGTEFVICLNVKGIPENVTSLRARFDGVGFAGLTLVTEGVYTGNSPASETLGKVAVTVGSLDDTWNSPDETEFEYHPNVTQELQKLLSKMPDTKRNIPLDDQTFHPSRSAGTVCSPSSFSSYAGDRSSLADESQDISSLKALQCILFAAAATNDRKCVETIFSTSAGEAVFQTYRNSSILPEDIARARGHQNLAEYLQNVHKRLSEEIDCNVQTVTIDWVELKRVTAKKNFCSGADEFQPMGDLEHVSFLESDDDQSSYFADDEMSVCQSPSTSEFSNEDQHMESKYTDDAEMLEHLRNDDDHGDQFDELKLSSAFDKVFDSVHQVESSNDRGAGTVEPRDSWLRFTALQFAASSKASTVGFGISPATGTVKISDTREILTTEEAPAWFKYDEILTMYSRVESLTSWLERNSPSVTGKRFAVRTVHVSRCESMDSSLKFSKQQINYYKLCYVVTEVLTEGLREIFKREWDRRFKATLGEWKDEPKNGNDFKNCESSQSRSRHARLLTTMRNGDRAKWDCSMLFYAILYSDCLRGLDPTLELNVKSLRRLCNEEFGHMPQGYLSDRDFQIAILKINTAFHTLGLPTQKIREVQTQTSFPTEELINIQKKVDNLQQEVPEKGRKLQEKDRALEEKENRRQTLKELLQTVVFSFCILPPEPTHDVFPRRSEVDQITQHLKVLKDVNNDRLSTLYLSGNPGSGKSQLGRLTPKRFFDINEETHAAISFVMTLNAESSETLLESYVSFARHCKCTEFAITNTHSSKDLSTDEKIASLKTLISTKIGHYTSWFLVVDNVTSLSRVFTYLPGLGNRQWKGGQLLITTQDTISIPSTSSSTQHISVSKGMLPDDASSLLRLLSGFTDDKMEKEIAQCLDYQPLALAMAAIYVRQVRESRITSNFSWTDYLKKVDKGQRRTTENILAQTDPDYPRTMTTVITLALEEAMTSNRALDHLFTFVSLCAPRPILKDIVVDYIMEMEKEFEDKDDFAVEISRCPLLLFDEEKSCVYIRVHGVVHYIVNSVTEKSARNEQIKSVLGALSSLSRFEDQDPLFIATKIVPHLAKLSADAEHLFSKEGIPQVAQIDVLTFQDYSNALTTLGRMCYNHSQYSAAKSYFGAVLPIIKLRDPSNELEKTNIYNQLGLVHRQLGDLVQAKDFHERVLDFLRKKLGPDHGDVATSYNNLGLVHWQLGDLKQAEDLIRRALDIWLSKLGPEHVSISTCYNNLGLVHQQLGDLKQAKDCHERAQDIRLKRLGSEHVDVALSSSNLGLIYWKLGDLKQAKDCHERALDIQLKKLGPEHVDVAVSLNNLGLVYRQLGDLKEAGDFHERALDIQLKKLGPEHVDVAMSYNNLALVHRQLGDLKQAKDCHERALEILRKKLGPEHVDVRTSYNYLKDVQDALDQLQ